MGTKQGAVVQMPPRTITTPARQHRFQTIGGAVERFAKEVPLTSSQRHLLGLIIDEAIEVVSPRTLAIVASASSND